MKSIPKSVRPLTVLDRFIVEFDRGMATVLGTPCASRPYPAERQPEPVLTREERRQSAGFMRVNYSGEVCAQALNHAQACVAKDISTKTLLLGCAEEENDHLAWCHQRLNDLGSHRSFLNFYWYTQAFCIGLLAGLAGDPWSLGFVEETEVQVTEHLKGHLNRLNPKDTASHAVLSQMAQDEIVHAETAQAAGAASLPTFIKFLMRSQAKVMTTLAYYI